MFFYNAYRDRVDAMSIPEMDCSSELVREGFDRARNSGESSYQGHVVDALAVGGDEGRRSLR